MKYDVQQNLDMMKSSRYYVCLTCVEDLEFWLLTVQRGDNFRTISVKSKTLKGCFEKVDNIIKKGEDRLSEQEFNSKSEY